MSPTPDHSVITVEHLDSMTVLTVSPDATKSATFDSVVSEPIVKTIETLKKATSDDRGARIVLLHLDDGSIPARFAEALLESLRGVCGSLTLEGADTKARVNLVRAASRADAVSTIRFLEQNAADFVAGSTIDLTKGEVR